MSLYARVLSKSDIDEIMDFEQKKLEISIPDEMERSIHSWNVRWRRESLEHFAPLGWSYLLREETQDDSEGALVGYFIAQPMLFFDGQTQSLWVEHLQFNNMQICDELLDLAYRLSRDKHFQKVFIPKPISEMKRFADLKGPSLKMNEWQSQVTEIRTTKV
jgi:hypothetical protein